MLVKTPFGLRMFKDSEGRWVQLPEEVSDEEFYKTQAEVKAAEQKLGKGPKPKPVPPVDKAAGKKAQKKEGAKGERKAAAGARGKGKAAGGAGAAAALKVASKSPVAQYLVAKAAPVLAKGRGVLAMLRSNEQTHDDAQKKRQQSEQAVLIPASENQAKSNNAQVGTVGARPAPLVDPNKGKATLQASLQKNIPKNIEGVDNFKRDKKAQHMGGEVMQVVTGDKNAVVSTFADMGQTPPPAPPEHTPEALPPMERAPATPVMNLGQGAIALLQPEHTDVSKYTKEADSKLKEEGVTQEQLDMVDSGELAEANKEKKGMEKTARTEPLAIRKSALQEATKVDADLKQEEKKERSALGAKRKGQLGATGVKQKTAKSALEKKREEVSAKINGIYKAAQDKVKKKLADLETQSMKRFDDGNAQATKAFEDNVKSELDAFKADRYSGWFGWARKAKDWLLGMDELPGVKAIFDRNRATFVAAVDKLVADISADNKRVIQECKDDLAKAKKDIQDYVDKLGPALKDIGKQAAEEMNGKLAELDRFVGQKEQELQQKLADKQKAAIQAIDQKIEKMKEAMSGALAKLGKLLLWAAKKFFTWALSKFGYSLEEIEGIINKGAAVLKAILTKPIVFVKNLMNAAITGFKNFGKNFLKHLKDALFEWLTGALEGIKLPTSWDFKGIVGLALEMIGISYANVRKHMVVVMGEPVVAGLEKAFTLVKTLITQGPMAAWEQLKEMAAEMRDAFLDAIKDFIKWKVIEEAVKWLVGLFIPGAGIIKAIIGIYDTVVFFIQKAKQIAKMVGDFLGAIGQIAAGNIAPAAQAMEAGLARGLSLVISFLAALLRLGGITAKIRNAIQKVRDKVDGVLAKVAKWIADKAKKLFGALLGGKKEDDPEKAKKLAAGVAAIDLADNALKRDGRISKEDAEAVVAKVKKAHPVFQTLLVVDGGETWDYEYTASPKKKKKGEKKKTSSVATGASKATAIEIKWVKPATKDYPPIQLAPKAEVTKARIKKGRLLLRTEVKALKGSFLARPLSPRDLDGYQIGVTHAVAKDIKNGFAFQAGTPVTGNSKKDKFNSVVESYGYNREDNSDPPTDGDHVLEKQLGGPDDQINVWPLNSSTNRSSGGTVRGEIARIKEERKPLKSIAGLWLKLKLP